MRTDIKEDLSLISFYMDYHARLYWAAKENGESYALVKILDQEHDVFTDIEVFCADTMPWVIDLTCDGSFRRCDKLIQYYESVSIYDYPAVIRWMQQKESIKKYPNYYQHILVVENIRILALKLCKKSKELGIAHVDMRDHKSQFGEQEML